MKHSIHSGGILRRLIRAMAMLAMTVLIARGSFQKAQAATHELENYSGARYTVEVGDILNMYTTDTRTDNFDWFIGNNTEKALEIGADNSGRTVTIKAVGAGTATVNCVSSVKTTVNKPYQFYNVYTNKWETRYNTVTETTDYSCICTIVVEDNSPPKIEQQPKNAYAVSGAKVTTSVKATGTGGLKYQWYYAESGSSTYKKSSVTTDTYSCTMTSARNGRKVYCVVTNGRGQKTRSETAVLRIPAKITVTTQPQSRYAAANSEISVKAKASGTGTLKYQWYYAEAGSTVYKKSSITGTSYVCTMNEERDGRKVYCLVTDAYGQKTKTNTAVLKMAKMPKITTQPVSKTARNGSQVSISVGASGTGTLKYQWYYAKPGTNSFVKSAITSKTYTTTMNDERNGAKVYCVVTDNYGQSVKSEAAAMTMKGTLTIVSQPQSDRLKSGATFKTEVEAVGVGTLKYQWYYASPGSSTFAKSSIRAAEYSCKVDSGSNGRRIYCVITDSDGNKVKTDTVTIRMAKKLTITTQPTNGYALVGGKVSVKVAASGTGTLKYQWYYGAPGSTTFKKSANTTATYTTTLTEGKVGARVYCVVKDNYGQSVKSNVVALNVPAVPAFTLQPVDTMIGDGLKVTVKVAASGTGKLTYQWYYMDGETGFYKKSSVTGKTYSITMNAERNGRRVYCIVTDSYGQSVKSKAAKLTMAEELTITQQPQDLKRSVSNGTANFSISVSGKAPYTYRWYKAKAGETKFTLLSESTDVRAGYHYITLNRTAEHDGCRYYCVVADTYGQKVKSNVVSYEVIDPLVITKQPESLTVPSGTAFRVGVEFSGPGEKTYRWYYRKSVYSEWKLHSSGTTTGNSSYWSSTMGSYYDGMQFYCSISNQYGDIITSDVITLKMS